MTAITKELERVVHENLNDVQMGVFKREMDRLQSIEVEFVQQREEHKQLKERHAVLSKEYESKKSEIDSILSRENDLNRREREMTDQKTQLHIDNQLIELRRENAEQRVEDHKSMVGMIFRGPVFQKTVVESRTHDQVVAVAGDENNVPYAHTENNLMDNTTTTTTIEGE